MPSMTYFYCIMDNIRKTEKILPLVLFKGSESATTAFLRDLTSQGLSKKDSLKTKVLTAIVPRCSVVPIVFLRFFKERNKTKDTPFQKNGKSSEFRHLSFVGTNLILYCSFHSKMFPFYIISVNLTFFLVSSFSFSSGRLSICFYGQVFFSLQCLLALYSFLWVRNKSCQAKDCTADSTYLPALPSLQPPLHNYINCAFG